MYVENLLHVPANFRGHFQGGAVRRMCYNEITNNVYNILHFNYTVGTVHTADTTAPPSLDEATKQTTHETLITPITFNTNDFYLYFIF